MYAAFRAPTEVPITRSGTMPRSAKAWSIPTWTAPRLPPPERTNAVVAIGSGRAATAIEHHGEAGQGERPQQETEVPQGNVVVVPEDEEVDDDAGQPRRDQ